jgi:hypothetical protein
MDISQLPDESRIWMFGISPALDPQKSTHLLRAVDGFLDQWTAHGAPIVSARQLVHGSFLIVAVDRQSETSGCSIDRMFGLLQQLEGQLGVSILDPNRVFYRAGDGSVQAISRAQFRALADAHTIVFDTLAERLGDLRSGRWERPTAESWHAQLLRKTS